jgi:hypothetical protein
MPERVSTPVLDQSAPFAPPFLIEKSIHDTISPINYYYYVYGHPSGTYSS